MNPIKVSGLLLDMNGLFRRWHNVGARTGEQISGLPEGTLDRYAYGHPNYRLARVGVLTDQQWADDVAQRLKDDFGPRALDAIGPWRADRGTTDLVMLDILAQARRRVPVAVLSNTTDAFRTDLIHHGIINLFDGIFPSAELRVDKPSPLAYLTAAQRMNIAPDQLYYCDDEPSFVAGARDAGLQAKLFTNPADFAQSLTQLGIPIQLN